MKTIRSFIHGLHADERGDIPAGSILVIGLIAIPLVIALMTFKEEILKWLTDQFGKVQTASDSTQAN